MSETFDAVAKLIFEFSKLPGIGEKSATRLAYHILKQDSTYSKALADALLEAKTTIRLCQECLTFTDQKICRICADPQRENSVLCVVEKPSDVQAMERSIEFRGKYHVLHGVLSPLEGVGPDDLKIRELLQRIEKGATPVKEVVLATNPSVEGDATSLYLSRLLAPLGVKVTKLAHGIPVGGALEYTDRQTLSRAMENRMEVR